MANKSGKHLASLVKRIQSRPTIILRDNESDALIRNNKLINSTFKSFYEMLYKSEQGNLSDPSSFLDRIHLKQLSEDKREILSSEITGAEKLQTIKTFSLKKAPGMDGFPTEFYSTFWSKLAPIFIQMTRHMSENQVLPKSMYQAIISVILKPGKSGESPVDYRPISLINCDNKILTKLMSNRLSKILPDLIHKNQTGFIKNRCLQTNTRICFGIIQHVKKHNLNLTVMAVDAEKAFDRLEWPFLFKVLEKFPRGIPQFCETCV